MRKSQARMPRFMQNTGIGFLAAMVILSYSMTACGSSPPKSLVPVCSTTGTHDRQIIFLHGVNQNASFMGVIQNPTTNDAFVPLLESLKCVYNPANIHIFQYLDDQALAGPNGTCPAGILPPCASQGSVSDNAVRLANMINSLNLNANQKVTLIAYSMGGAIIRSALAECPYVTASGAPMSGCNVASLVSDVFFINAVQEGSWLLGLKQGLDTSNNPLEIALGWASYSVAKASLGLDANYPAEIDMTPGSSNIQLHNQNAPPNNIHYFNFFGDIQLHPVSNILGFVIPGASNTTISAGDLVLLPGADDPQAVSVAGGSRFCMACGTQDSTGYSSNGMYSQWALTDTLSWDYSVLAQFIQSLGEGLPRDKGLLLLGNIINAPEAHLQIDTDASLYTSSIQVEDYTGRGGKTSITNEILWQLEKEDGIS